MIFFQTMTKIKNHQPQGVSNGKKFLKKKKLSIGKINNNDEEEEEWQCQECEELWDDESGDRWIVCDICYSKFHLEI